MKILVSAYACSPFQGSEAAVGWGFVSALARHHDLWVIVEEEKCRADVERYLVDNPDISRSVQFFFLHKQRNRALRNIWPPSYYWYYGKWQKDALKLAQNLHLEVDFDIAHQLTMVGFREPGYLWQLGIPFVWGPIGGMGSFPWRFFPVIGWYSSIYYLAYNLFNSWQLRFSQRPKLAAKSAGAGLIAATADIQVAAEKYWNSWSTLICEAGLPPATARKPVKRKPCERLRIVWVGQLVARKALNLGIQALANLPKEVDWELHVLGEGPRALAWQRRSQQLGVSDRCIFHGWRPRDEALNMIASSHLMLITSLRDLTSIATIEALALGLPIVCLDHCGFAAVVDDTCGIKVPVTTPSLVVAGLTRSIYQLAQDEKLRQVLAAGALQRAKDFSWEKKAELVNRIYDQKLGLPANRTL